MGPRTPATIAVLSRRKGGAREVPGHCVALRLVGQRHRVEHGCSGHVTATAKVLKVAVVRFLRGRCGDVKEIRLAMTAVRVRGIRCSTPRWQIHVALHCDGVAERGSYRVPTTAERRILGERIVGRINGYHIGGRQLVTARS